LAARGRKAAVITKVRTIDGFGAGNDPYGAHDFVAA
jgi:hypothetical protein